MKYSFIIPVYKKKLEVFRKCLRSLFDQSHKDIEVVCVFDGKDEALEAVAAEFQKAKAITIEHGGACKARNAGFKESSGEAVVFWDADCYAEPEMTKVWDMIFERHPYADFVYGGYAWSDPGIQPFDPEPQIDAWLLSKYNYLHSMNPLKREKVVEWDESLDGLQDWDFWRRVVAAGATGVFNRGYGFTTELPDHGSISGQGVDKKNARLAAVRAKHKDPSPDILVGGFIHKREAVRLAKLLEADYFPNPDYYVTRPYKMAIAVGFNTQEMEAMMRVFTLAGEGAKKVIYWMGQDAEALQYGPYKEVKGGVEALSKQNIIHYCQDSRSQGILEEVGIKADVLPFPRDPGDLLDALPKEFKVLADFDEPFAAHAKAIIKALPDVKIDVPKANSSVPLTDYTAILRFSPESRLNEGAKYALIQGRYLISNIQAPFAGYVEIGDDVTKFKNEVIDRIRELQKADKINQEARDFYMDEMDPQKFKGRIQSLLALEVVNG